MTNSAVCPNITSVQEIEVFRFSEQISKYDKEQLKQVVIHLFQDNLKLYNTTKLLTAKVMDLEAPIPGFSCEADMRKRLEMIDESTTGMVEG